MGRTPNTALVRVMAEADWGNGQLARAVNRAGAEAGLTLSHSASTVTYWLRGSLPKKPVRPVVAEALSRRLGRPVSCAELGFVPSDGVAGSGTGEGDDPAATGTRGLADLARKDMDPSRRGVLTAGLYSAALTVPGFGDSGAPPDLAAEEVTAGRTVRIGSGEVATVRTMTQHIAIILDDLGGGHARPMAAAFLTNTVLSWLRADATAAVRRDMQAAASDFVYLTGWMAMYERAHGLGQRYFVQALELARDAQDHLTYCRTLRGMALQAANLRYGRRALEYADSAAEAAPVAGPRLVAFLRGQQAHGAALVKDRRQAFGRLRETEAALARADGRNDAVGGYDQAAYHFHVSHVLYELGDLPGSITALQRSNRVRSPHERQGRVHAHGVLAARQWERGHVEAACATWDRFLDDYTALSTARGDEHFAVLRGHVAAKPRSRVVRTLGERARVVAEQKSAA
ncbi:regulatory protein [Streptomyces laurentii]|uniref:Regulatory protein n=1 Tax=Streptomyces laurentii TaxID=39478 RepID=A0A160P2F1_STRLU|nr:regulatory protein [Streptomyces laurentii]